MKHNKIAQLIAALGALSITNEGEQAVAETAGAPTTPPAKPKAKKAAKPKAKPAKAKKAAKKAKAKKGDVEGMGILREYAEKYEKPVDKKGERVKTPAGNPVIDCGDEVATALRGKDLAQVYEVVAKRIGESVASLKTRYGKLNLGQQRMNLGNRLRGYLNAKQKAKSEKK